MLSILFIFACLMSASISAEVVTYDDAPIKNNIQVREDDIVVFDDGFTTLSAYVTKDSTALAGWLGFFDFSYVNSKTGKAYTSANVIEYDIPQGIVKTEAYAMTRFPAIKRVSIPDSVISIGGCTFERSATLEECTFEHNESSELKEIPTWMFGFCSSLKAISFPDCIEKITGNTQFAECNELTAIYLPKNLKLTEGSSQTGATFGMLKKAYFVNEPFTYDNIPTKPTVYYFPANYASMTGETFDSCKNLNDVLVFLGDNISIGQYAFENVRTDNGDSKPTIVFLGNTSSIDAKGWTVNAIYFANANDVDAASAGLKNNGGSAYFCNAQGNTNHLAEKTVFEEARCEVNAGEATYCFCGHLISKEEIEGTALDHDYDYINGNATLISISYLDISKDGTKIVKCGICNEDGELTANKIFGYKGYSKKENKNNAVCVGYDIDYDALAEYEEFASVDYVYGFVAAANNNTPLDENANAGKNVIKTDLSDSKFISVEFILTAEDWTTGPASEAKLSINMYVIVNNAVKYITANGYSDTAEAKTYLEI